MHDMLSFLPRKCFIKVQRMNDREKVDLCQRFQAQRVRNQFNNISKAGKVTKGNCVLVAAGSYFR